MATQTDVLVGEQAAAPQRARKTLLGHVPFASPMYQFHPVTRLIMFLFFGMLPLFIFIPWVNICLIIICLIIMKWSRVDMRRIRMYLPIMFTVAIFMFTVSILAPGRDPSYTPIQIGPINAYYQPLFFTFAAYWRLIAMLFGTIMYFSINHERDMLVALRTLRLPFTASYVLGLSIRSAGMFMEDFRTIREAEQARGLDTKAMKFSDQVKLYMMYLIPLFSIALRRAEEISNALFARGFTVSGRTGTGEKRADYIRSLYTVRRRDYVACAALILIFLIVAVAQVGFGVFAIEHAPLNIYLKGILGIP